MKLHLLVLGPALMALACGKEPQPRTDSVAQSGAAGTDAKWVAELGPMLAIPGDSEHTAIVLFPHSPEDSSDVALMRTAGDSSVTARLVPTELQVCGDAATARLSSNGPDGWSVALAGGATTVRMDSIESLSAADSAALAADVARLASTVPNDAESRFAGLPFGVLAAHRMSVAGTSIVVARVARRIPQEATPLEERTILIGDRSADGPLVLRFSRRSSGAEDAVDHFALLAAVRSGEKVFVILESERGEGSRYDILERSASGSWTTRWSRALTC